MHYFSSTASAFLAFAIYLLPLMVMWIYAFYLQRSKKPITGIRHAAMIVMTIAYIGLVYHGTFGSYFFGVDLSGRNTLTLMYLYPQRTRALDTASISAIDRVPAYKGNYQMVIRMKNGERIEGAPSSRLDVEDMTRQTKFKIGEEGRGGSP